MPELRWRDGSHLDIEDMSFFVAVDPQRWHEASTVEEFTALRIVR